MARIYSIELTDAYEEDFEKYYAHKSEKEDIYWNGFFSKPDYEGIKKAYLSRIALKGLNYQNGKLIKAIKVNKEYAGYVQFTFSGTEVEIGIGVSASYSGRGIGKKAIALATKWLKENVLTKELIIFSRIRDDNVQSQHCFMAVGFDRTNIYTLEEFYPIEEKVILRRYVYAEK